MSLDTNNYDNRVKTVQIDELILVHRSGTFDIYNSNALVEMNIYEDMYSMGLTGSITILDNGGYFEDFPICGDEELLVRFKPAEEFPGPFFDKKFVVYKCEPFTTVKGSRTRSYTLLFASKILVKNTQIKIRRSWKEKKESEIVTDICTNLLGIDVEVEETRYQRDIVIPAWRPFYTINYLAGSCVRSRGYPASNYLFFENARGFHFKSIDSLIENEPSVEIDFHVSRASVKREITKIWNASDYRIVQTFDALKQAANGMYAHRFQGLDIIKKQIKNFDYIYNGEFSGQVHVDPGGAKLRENHSSALDQRISYGPFQKKYNSEHADDWMKRRMPMMEEFGSWMIECSTEGNTNVSVGDKVRFNLTSNKSDNDEDDKRLSGNYLVTKILHTVNYKEHNMVAAIVKDSLYS